VKVDPTFTKITTGASITDKGFPAWVTPRFPVRWTNERGTGKSPGPAGSKACATQRRLQVLRFVQNSC